MNDKLIILNRSYQQPSALYDPMWLTSVLYDPNEKLSQIRYLKILSLLNIDLEYYKLSIWYYHSINK